MKKLLTVTAALWLIHTMTAQESVGPITRMHLGKSGSNLEMRVTATFDSTFYYITDTLTLPFFDDFSRSKFQQYDAQFTDPNLTEELSIQQPFPRLVRTTMLKSSMW